MIPQLAGSPHSIQRQVLCGVVAGSIAAFVAWQWNVDLTFATTITAGNTVGGDGIERKRRLNLTGLHRKPLTHLGALAAARVIPCLRVLAYT